MREIKILKASESDYKQITELLRNSNLPIKGVKEILDNTFVAKDGSKIIGCSALEIFNTTSLLRSVAVNKEYQRMGIGFNLSNKAIELSKDKNIKEIYLLTETAESFFNRIGFYITSRSETPNEIQNSEEFSSICPSSASVLRLDIF